MIKRHYETINGNEFMATELHSPEFKLPGYELYNRSNTAGGTIIILPLNQSAEARYGFEVNGQVKHYRTARIALQKATEHLLNCIKPR